VRSRRSPARATSERTRFVGGPEKPGQTLLTRLHAPSTRTRTTLVPVDQLIGGGVGVRRTTGRTWVERYANARRTFRTIRYRLWLLVCVCLCVCVCVCVCVCLFSSGFLFRKLTGRPYIGILYSRI
jgi:hypothetical protein